MNSVPRSALVVGGGIVGLSCALALQRAGLGVQIMNQPGAQPPASWGNAGHIAIEQSQPLASWQNIRNLPQQLYAFGGAASFPLAGMRHWLPFGLHLLRAATPERYQAGETALRQLLAQALPAWQRLLGPNPLLRQTGHIICWTDARAAKAGRQQLLTRNSAAVTFQELTAEEAALLQAQIKTPIAGAVRCNGTASVADPGAVLKYLQEQFITRGGAWHSASYRPGETANVDVTVIAAGVYSAPLLRALGHTVPLIAERGYHVQATQSDWPEALPPVVFEDQALFMNRFTSGIRATSFIEFTSADAPPDDSKWHRLEQKIATLGLPFKGEYCRWFGSRPTLPDYLPAIGQSTRNSQIFYAFGHQHLGLTLGPVTGELLAAMILNDRPLIDMRPYRLERFEG